MRNRLNVLRSEMGLFSSIKSYRLKNRLVSICCARSLLGMKKKQKSRQGIRLWRCHKLKIQIWRSSGERVRQVTASDRRIVIFIWFTKKRSWIVTTNGRGSAFGWQEKRAELCPRQWAERQTRSHRQGPVGCVDEVVPQTW